MFFPRRLPDLSGRISVHRRNTQPNDQARPCRTYIDGHEPRRDDAAFRSVVSTAKANSASVLDVLRIVLSDKPILEPLAETG